MLHVVCECLGNIVHSVVENVHALRARSRAGCGHCQKRSIITGRKSPPAVMRQ